MSFRLSILYPHRCRFFSTVAQRDISGDAIAQLDSVTRMHLSPIPLNIEQSEADLGQEVEQSSTNHRISGLISGSSFLDIHVYIFLFSLCYRISRL